MKVSDIKDLNPLSHTRDVNSRLNNKPAVFYYNLDNKKSHRAMKVWTVVRGKPRKDNVALWVKRTVKQIYLLRGDV